MIKGTIPNYYFIQEMPEHEKIKDIFLEEFLQADFEPAFSDGEQISISDWKWNRVPRNWTAGFKTLIIPLLKDLCDEMYADNAVMNQTWFQQYYKNDYHGWHVHTGVNYSGVYLLECPDGMETEFFDVTTGEKFELGLKEGDIITYPGNVLHRSKPNDSNSRKTIVAWNVDFKSKDDSLVNKALEIKYLDHAEQHTDSKMSEAFNDGEDVLAKL